MHIRKTTTNDLPSLMAIFKEAREYMAANGNPHQWVNRPTEEDILTDIREGHSYVCVEEETVVGTFAYIPGPDPTYAVIYDGAWPDEGPYGVIHRIAGSKGARGVAAAAFGWAFEQCDRMRIDTHEDNHIMQDLLKKHGFCYCGVILLGDGSPRLAYFKHRL